MGDYPIVSPNIFIALTLHCLYVQAIRRILSIKFSPHPVLRIYGVFSVYPAYQFSFFDEN
ncbi:Uncharacterised protein [Yersinia massiliensis]|nr:Uncharacterised protein [Yersinia massiliensis]